MPTARPRWSAPRGDGSCPPRTPRSSGRGRRAPSAWLRREVRKRDREPERATTGTPPDTDVEVPVAAVRAAQVSAAALPFRRGERLGCVARGEDVEVAVERSAPAQPQVHVAVVFDRHPEAPPAGAVPAEASLPDDVLTTVIGLPDVAAGE